MNKVPFSFFNLIMAVIAFMIGAWLGWLANSFLAQDRCLDHGGSWNSETRTCIGETKR